MALYTKRIVSAITEKFPSVNDIVLYGSYGRGEGAWYSEGGEILPYNDFDLLIVFDEISKVPNLSDIPTFRRDLANKLGIRWIDIAAIQKSSLKRTKNSIYGYDLKYGSTILFGEESLLQEIGEKNSKDISLIEGEILFFTRLWTFCGSFKEASDLKGDDARFFRNQMAKAVLACVDSILLINGSYHYSYRKRHELARKLKNNQFSDTELDLIDWAFEQKQRPTGTTIQIESLNERYTLVAKFYRKYMLRLLSEFHQKDFGTILDFKKYYRRSLKVNLKRLLYCLGKQSFRFERVYWSNIIQMNVLSQILKEPSQIDLNNESQKILKKLRIETSSNFDDIRLAVAHLRESI